MADDVPTTPVSPPAPPPNPIAMMRSPAYLRLLVLAVLLGIPVAAAACGFLKLTSQLQQWTFTDLPKAVGFSTMPTWWVLIPLAAAGLITGLTVRYLPGRGGESPADGLASGKGPPRPSALPGIVLAALASVGLGAVVGPEAPLIAIGAGLAYLAVVLSKRNLPAQATAVVALTGSFAAISTLLGTPLAGAFLLLEMVGVGGAMATAVLLPGLLGAGVGALIFTGLDSLTGVGTFSLAVPDLPTASAPTGAEFGWAIAVGVVAGPLIAGLRWLALAVRDRVKIPTVPMTFVVGLAVAGLAIAYAETTGHSTDDVLFSGQSDLPALLTNADSYTVLAVLMLLPRRPHLPGHVPRRRRRGRAGAPTGAAARACSGDRDRRDDRRDAPATDVGRIADVVVPRVRRIRGDPADHRVRGRRLPDLDLAGQAAARHGHHCERAERPESRPDHSECPDWHTSRRTSRLIGQPKIGSATDVSGADRE